MKLKLCGIRRKEDIDFINQYPPDYIGYVFAESRRRISASEAAALSSRLNKGVRTVGVFVNSPLSNLLDTAYTAKLSVIQLHGDEDAAFIQRLRKQWSGSIWKAVRVRSANDIHSADQLPVDALLLDAFSPDAYGGTGHTVPFDFVASHRPEKPFFLAGGLYANNVCKAIQTIHPYGIDISSGIETDGCKDLNKIKEIDHILRGELWNNLADSDPMEGSIFPKP